MAHCKYNEIEDLEPVFEVVRTFTGVKEKSREHFITNQKDFSISTLKMVSGGLMCGAGKTGGPEVPISMSPTQKEIRSFIQTIEKCYEKTARQ